MTTTSLSRRMSSWITIKRRHRLRRRMTLALNPYGCAGRLTMRGDPTNRRELLAGFLLVLLILALVAIALQDVM